VLRRRPAWPCWEWSGSSWGPSGALNPGHRHRRRRRPLAEQSPWRAAAVQERGGARTRPPGAAGRRAEHDEPAAGPAGRPDSLAPRPYEVKKRPSYASGALPGVCCPAGTGFFRGPRKGPGWVGPTPRAGNMLNRSASAGIDVICDKMRPSPNRARLTRASSARDPANPVPLACSASRASTCPKKPVAVRFGQVPETELQKVPTSLPAPFCEQTGQDHHVSESGVVSQPCARPHH